MRFLGLLIFSCFLSANCFPNDRVLKAIQVLEEGNTFLPMWLSDVEKEAIFTDSSLSKLLEIMNKHKELEMISVREFSGGRKLFIIMNNDLWVENSDTSYSIIADDGNQAFVISQPIDRLADRILWVDWSEGVEIVTASYNYRTKALEYYVWTSDLKALTMKQIGIAELSKYGLEPLD